MRLERRLDIPPRFERSAKAMQKDQRFGSSPVNLEIDERIGRIVEALPRHAFQVIMLALNIKGPVDMLVKLYTLPDAAPFIERAKAIGVSVQRARSPEKRVVARWVEEQFGEGWAAECETAFSQHPVSCFVAVTNRTIHGFACYDATAKGFFGPQGVAKPVRGQRIGQALLVTTLQAMQANGYAYAIIGAAGPTEFYRKTVGAVIIEGSKPGFYRDLIR